MRNQIILNLPQQETHLVGEEYGKEIYESQVKDKVDYSAMNEIVIPKSIEDISISFIKGFISGILKDIRLDEFSKYFCFIGNERVVEKAKKSVYF